MPKVIANKPCECCKNIFFVKKYLANKQRFCSLECRSKVVMGCLNYWKGKHRDKATKDKISKTNSGPKSYKWSGGRRLDHEGYVLVYHPDHPTHNSRGYVREHRYVVEKFLNIELNHEYEPHHIDKNKENNNLSNIIVFKTKSAHRRFELGKSVVNQSEIFFDGRKL